MNAQSEPVSKDGAPEYLPSSPIPVNEGERLAEVRRYRALDDEPSEAYQYYAHIAANLFDAPIAAITLIDSDTQLIKSTHGVGLENIERDITLCTHTVFQAKVLCVPNTLEDARFKNNPLVTGAPHLRFYAGAPLITANGHCIGTLCVTGDKARQGCDQNCLDLLSELAACVMNKFDLQLEIARRKQAEIDQNRAIDLLEHAKQELEQFSYSASHDLQEPLRTVAQQCLLARTYSAAGEREEVQEALSTAWAATARMQNLVDGFVSFLTLGHIELLRERVDLNELVARMTKGGSMTVNGHRGEVIAHDLPTVRVDRDYFQRLFQNLIHNGLKFNRSGNPTVWISAERDGEGTVILFCDNGVGVPDEIAHCIFEIFQRGHSSQEFAGSGIGLASAKRIVERHGGEIWLEQHDRPGTTIAISLPAEGIVES